MFRSNGQGHHPGGVDKEASRHFLGDAATPPRGDARRGIRFFQNDTSKPHMFSWPLWNWSENGRSQIRDRFEQLARMTGGRAFFSEPETDCSEVVLQIFQRWRYEYRVEFYSSSASAELPDAQVMLRDPRERRVIIRSRLPIS